MLVDMSTIIYSYPVSGFVFAHLPSNSVLWDALHLEGWMTAHMKGSEKHPVYGLSDTGALKRFQKIDAGIELDIAEWDEWNAEVGDFGALVMIIGSLL